MSDYALENETIRTGELTERVLKHFGCSGNSYVGGQKHVGMTQLRTDAGWDVSTADVVVMGAWKSTNHLIQGFEVKISRSDWLNEVKKPNKNDAIRQYCDKFWLVIADEKMVKEGELPEDWGMMVVSGTGLRIVKQAPTLEPIPITKGFLAMMMRCNQSETIPQDVHMDKMKDLQRKYEADYKQRYAGLTQFIKDICKELGIQIKHDDYHKSWYAQIGSWEINKIVANGNHQLTAEQLAAAVKIALKGDMRTIKWELESVAGAAEKMLEIAKAFRKDEPA
jgi:hypothetical protein